MKIFIFLVLFTVIFCQETCNITISDDNIIRIRSIVNKATHIRLIVRDYQQHNLSNMHYFVSKTTSLFLLEPSSNFYTFGLISRDFYALDLQIYGNFCDITNGRDSRLSFQKDEVLMSYIFNVIKRYTNII